MEIQSDGGIVSAGADEIGGAVPSRPPEITPPADWRAAAAGGNERVAKALESVADVRGLAASYAELRAAVSTGKFANKIVLPDADAPDEDWARFRAALPDPMRAPATADDYVLQAPDWMSGPEVEGGLQGFAAAMHEAGATQAQLRTALDHYYELAARGRAEQERADTRYLQESEAALRRDWGEDYDRNRALAARAVQTLFGEDGDVANLVLKDGSLLGSLPSFARGMAKVGRSMNEDPLVGQGDAGGQDLQTQIDAITAQGMRDGDYYTDGVQQKLQRLYADLHGEERSRS